MIRATATDADAIARLVNSAYCGDVALKGWTTEATVLLGPRTDSDRIRQLIQSPNSVVLTLRNDHAKLLACVHLERKNESTAYLGMLSVEPTIQTVGLGKALLATAEKFVNEEWKMARIEMTVLSFRSELIAWYERNGYQRTGERLPFPRQEAEYRRPVRDDLEFVVLAKEKIKPRFSRLSQSLRQ